MNRQVRKWLDTGYQGRILVYKRVERGRSQHLNLVPEIGSKVNKLSPSPISAWFDFLEKPFFNPLTIIELALDGP